MANTDIEKLIVSLEARTKEYEKALAKAQGTTVTQLRKIEREAQGFATRFDAKMGRIGSSIKGFGAGLVGGLGIEALASAAATAIKSVAEIGDQAKKLGLTNSAFQELSAAAKYSGSDVEALAKSMKKLGLNTSEAARGNGEFGKLLSANGLSLTDVNGKMKTQVHVLGMVADLVKNAANEQDALAIAQIALGKSGTDLMELLSQGAAGVSEAMRFASEEGVKFTDRQIAKAQEFDDKIDVLKDKISVGLKGAFIDAAIGAESYATRAAAALESVGVSTDNLKQSFIDALKYNPFALSTTLAAGALMGEGASKGGPVAMDPALAGMAAAAGPYSAGGKGDRVTVMPTKTDDTALRERIRLAKEAARAEEQRREAVMRVLDAMEFESAQAKRSEREQFIQNELRSAGEKLTAAEAAQVRALAEARYAEIEAQKLADANKEISLENQKELIAAQEEQNQKAMEALEAQKEGWMNLASLGVSALDAIVIGGENASDVLKDMAKQLASAALQASLLGQGPLAGLFGTSGGGGLFGSLVSGIVGGGGVSAGIYHSGGVVGSGGARRTVSPGMFSGAERYHKGGIAGLRAGEVPAILQKGEMVLPRGSRGGGGGNNVQIFDQRQGGAPVSTQTDSMGALKVFIRDELKQQVPSILSKQMPTQFGINPKNTTR